MTQPARVSVGWAGSARPGGSRRRPSGDLATAACSGNAPRTRRTPGSASNGRRRRPASASSASSPWPLYRPGRRTRPGGHAGDRIASQQGVRWGPLRSDRPKRLCAKRLNQRGKRPTARMPEEGLEPPTRGPGNQSASGEHDEKSSEVSRAACADSKAHGVCHVTLRRTAANDSDAGGGTRTPDTRIMIGPRFAFALHIRWF